MVEYAELQVTSNYSFLRGASHPGELVLQAAALGHSAIAITDRNSLAGVVRAHVAAKKAGLRLVVGCRLDLQDAPSLLVFPQDRAAYGRLSQLLTIGKRRTEKGDCRLYLADILDGKTFQGGAGQMVIALPPEKLDAAHDKHLLKLKYKFQNNLYLSVKHNYYGDDFRRIYALTARAKQAGISIVATNDVHYHVPERRRLHDVLSCIREHCPLTEAGYKLMANSERHLKSPKEMARLFTDYPATVENTQQIVTACTFNLDELRYEYPVEPVPEGRSPQEELVRLTGSGAKERYPRGVPEKVQKQIDHELDLIGELNYAPYFLTIYDIIRFARGRRILCQGRGSAANSAVCYCIGITSVDPARIDLLFERFVSAERDEPPDIDVDFEHERREEVIQYIYEKYGRDRASLTATVISYRMRSAIREVSKVMGLSEDTIQAMTGLAWRHIKGEVPEDEHIRKAGLDPTDETLRMTIDLAREIQGFPRHLSQHPGGFVITKGPLDTVVPVENAAMEDRTVIEWDKDDLDALGMLKIDVLGLGMLTCIRKAFDLIHRHHGRKMGLADVPDEDPLVYDMLCEGDSVGVFQVESRAQMAMLPRLKPREFYDLVIEVAIVRPGPIQGDMVHPYLRRRNGEEAVEFPSKELEEVLGKTMGVPLFQEQAMKIAIVAAGFTPNEADGLRRAMATFRHTGTIPSFKGKFIDGMIGRGYDPGFSERCFRQIEGFADYGFPESHSASFALLVYISAWIKCHYPAVFAAAILNSQPMGFYAPAQLVRDAREHGVEVRPPDINDSEWECTLEPAYGEAPEMTKGHEEWRDPLDLDMAVRLGFRQIKGFREDDADLLVDRRENGYREVADLRSRGQLNKAALDKLARADAFQSLGLDRRQALWSVTGLTDAAPLPLFEAMDEQEIQAEPAVTLPEISLGETVADDYRAMKLSLKAHPMNFLRDGFANRKFITCDKLTEYQPDDWIRIAGVVLIRQRPGSAKGVVFITIEDETGVANIIVWPHTLERYRKTVLGSCLIGIEGRLQREGIVTHIVAHKLYDHAHRLNELVSGPHDFPGPPDEFKRPIYNDRRDPREVLGKKPRVLPGSRDFR